MNSLSINRRAFTLRATAASAIALSLARNVAADEHEASGMSVDDTRMVMDEYLAALLEGGDFGQYLHEDVVLIVMDNGDMLEGRDAVVEGIVEWHSVAFDAQPRMTRVTVDEGSAAAEILFLGTHTGEFGGMAATGAELRVPYVAFYSFADNLISEIRLYGLVYGIMQQLAAPATPQASPVATGGDEMTIHVELWEFAISADRMTVPAGQEITIVAMNSGSMVHELVIEPAGANDEPLEKDDVESEIEDIQPGSTAEMTWTFDEPGAYQFACHIPGHYELGMVLEFTVE
jgi:uncharacterized cupredoxin-like copper-binding protein